MKTYKEIIISIPTLLGTREFKPTRCAMQSVWAWVHQDEDAVRELLSKGEKGEGTDRILSMPQILKRLGYSRQNWYHWQKHKDFGKWLRNTVEELIKTTTLPEIHCNLARRAARTHDPSMIKLALQKFDSDFTERSSRDQRHSFAGYKPDKTTKELAEASRERKRKMLESKEAETVEPDDPVT